MRPEALMSHEPQRLIHNLMNAERMMRMMMAMTMSDVLDDEDEDDHWS